MESKDDKTSAIKNTWVSTRLLTEAYDQIPEVQLWDLFRTGDKKAFDIIYDRLFQALCGYGDKICPEKALVEDVIQDLFINLWTRKSHLGATDSIKFYLFCSLRRMLIRRMQQEGKRAYVDIFTSGINFQLKLSSNTSPTNVSEGEEERKKILAHALNKLTERQQEAIYLKFYNNLSFQEVAEVMEIEVRSVYNLIGRTIDILREDFKERNANAEVISLPSLLALLSVCLEYA